MPSKINTSNVYFLKNKNRFCHFTLLFLFAFLTFFSLREHFVLLAYSKLFANIGNQVFYLKFPGEKKKLGTINDDKWLRISNLLGIKVSLVINREETLPGGMKTSRSYYKYSFVQQIWCQREYDTERDFTSPTEIHEDTPKVRS